MRLCRRVRADDERGITMVLIALSLVALCGMAGLAIDVGQMFIARAELTRAADAAALAGVQSLPDLNKATADAVKYVTINEPSASATARQVTGQQQLQVTATKSVSLTFMRLFGRNSATVSASAVAGFSGALDVAVVLDTTASMNGAKLQDAKNAANTLVSMILPDASGQAAMSLVPFRSCYPPGTETQLQSCVPSNQVIPMTSNYSTIHNGINNMTANGVTNICTGLSKAKDMLTGAGAHPGSQTNRFLVLLSDGDNNPHFRSTAKWPASCDPGGENSDWGLSCQPTETPEKKLDQQTYAMANAIKALGVEIYVVGLGVCGSKSSATCNSTQIGVGDDTIQDRNLLKCIASSTPGTNDHYLETSDSKQLTQLFQTIGASIVTRLVQ